LTHFSQRYPKLPPGLEGPDAATAAVAFDGMCIPLVALPDLPKLLPLLHEALREREEPQEIAPEPSMSGSAVSGGSGGGAPETGEPFGGENGPEGGGTPDMRSSPTLPQHIRFDE
jgi:hypothetical protein